MSARKMGAAIATVSHVAQVEMMEAIAAIIAMSPVSADAWRDLLLVYAINEAHDQGVERADVEQAVAVIVAEEWATPNTAGRITQQKRAKRRPN